jgi:hypothetical protein
LLARELIEGIQNPITETSEHVFGFFM